MTAEFDELRAALTSVAGGPGRRLTTAERMRLDQLVLALRDALAHVRVELVMGEATDDADRQRMALRLVERLSQGAGAQDARPARTRMPS